MVSVNNNINTLYIDGKPVRKASLGGKVFYEKHNYHLGLVASPSSINVGETSEVTATVTDYSDPVEGENVKFYQVFEAEGHLSFTGQTFTVTPYSYTPQGFSGSEIVIDWGDGTTTNYVNENSLNHTYATEGDYAISLGGNISSFNSYCFYGCSGLTSVVIPDSVTSIGNNCFYGCSDLTSIVIPDSVTNIEGSCFERCTSLTSIVIPDSVTSIGTSCFFRCSGLTSVVIPDSVTNIGRSCFSDCSGLTSVFIPDSVTNIGKYCFWNCSGLTSVILNWETNIPTYNPNWFANISVPQLSIPNGTLQDYITAGYPSDKLVERGA